MNLIDRLTWLLTAVLALAVVLLSVVGPTTSAIGDDAVAYDHEKAMKRMRDERPVADGSGDAVPRDLIEARAAPRVTPARADRPADSHPDSRPAPDPSPGPDPAPRPDPGSSAPRPGPGVAVAYPVRVPASALDRYLHFEDLVRLGETAQGWPVERDGADAYEIGAIEPGSPLETFLGLRRGDVVISVNGRPASRRQARELHAELRSERSFEVVIERGGRRILVPYEVE